MHIVRVLVLAVMAVTFLILGTNVFSRERIIRLSDGQSVTFKSMLSDLKDADCILVGEIHNLKDDHRLQLRVIEGLHKAGVPLAVGLEMFSFESQQALDEWVSGTLDRERFIAVYYDNWKMPWPLYSDILLYARDERIPLLGLNVPEKVAARVAKEGFASLTKEEKAKLPPGITCDVDPTYMAFIREAYVAHGASEKSFQYFCEAQMVWNKSMAWRILAYLDKHPGERVVALTGSGHAMRRGIPSQINQNSGRRSKIILSQVAAGPSITYKDADYLVIR